MLEKAFCSNMAPSLSSGNNLFYKAEYMGRSCPNFMSLDTEHPAPENSGARCRHLAPDTSPNPGKWGIPVMREQCLSKTPNVTFVYLSKCNIKLPGIFENSKKRFL